MLKDSLIHPPIYEGTYGHNNFTPNHRDFPDVGETFKDEVFGTMVRRLTNDLGKVVRNDIYSRNLFFSSDGEFMFHNSPDGNNIISTRTGAIKRANIPGNNDASFHPTPIVHNGHEMLFFFEEKTLFAYDIETTKIHEIKVFPSKLESLGGSLDWISNNGQFMVLRTEGGIRLFDYSSKTFYKGKILGNPGNGYATITPSGNYIVTTIGGLKSYKIDHTARTISTKGVLFWTLCGDHGDLLSASDGKDYFITNDCYDEPGLWRVDITKPQTKADRGKQHDDNKFLLLTDWPDNDKHISCASRGARDWAFISTEANDDLPDMVSEWRLFKNEIFGVNVLTGEVLRVAHHKSRGNLRDNYRAQARVCVSPDGSKVAWASTMGLDIPGYSDIYIVDLGSDDQVPDPPPPVLSDLLRCDITLETSKGRVMGEVTFDAANLRRILGG